MQSKRMILYPAIFFVILAFLIHKPLPPGFCKSTLDKAVFHIIEPTLRFSYYWPSKLFFSKATGMVWWTRVVLNALSPILGPKWDSQGTIHTETVEWAGVRTRVYAPNHNRTTGGAVIFIHGGGFAQGNIDIYCSLTKRMADMMNSVVVSIDYRLSPETVYPGQIDDCERVIDYFMSIAQEKYGVNPAKIVIMGDSAGGNLAAVIAQRRKIRGSLPLLAGQVLIYPLLQLADLQSVSYRYFQKNLDGFALVDPESVVLYYMMYAGIDMDQHKELTRFVLTNGHVVPEQKKAIQKYLRYDELRPFNYSEEALPARAKVVENVEVQQLLAPWLLDPEFSPIMREDLRGLPKAFVITCEYDVLRDEGIMYARRLQEAGVPVTFRNYENGFHAMLNFHYEIQEASVTLGDIVKWTVETIDAV